ncbi:MAG: hypothetical protein RLZZ293_258 [Pseudomonadota bacterium]|jgi:hypothetical protein
MYLLNITNNDYIILTLVFGIVAITAYWFRRNNGSATDFFLATKTKPKHYLIYLSWLNFGFIELIFLAAYGAYAGISAVIGLGLAYIIISFICDKLISAHRLFSPLAKEGISSLNQQVILIIYAVFLLLACSVMIGLMVWCLKSLLGWQFGNSSLSLLAVVIISLLVGGSIGLFYNQLISLLISLTIILICLTSAYFHLGSYQHIVTNLTQVALSNGLSSHWFSWWQIGLLPWWKLVIMLILILFIKLIHPLALFRAESWLATTISPTAKLIINGGQLLIILLMVSLGIIALATPSKIKLQAGQQIVTEQTRMNDGGLAYVVRSINNSGLSHQRGLIPQQIDTNNSVEANNLPSYDYLSASLVTIKNYLPMAYVLLTLIILSFFSSISEILFFITLITIRGFYIPYFKKTNLAEEELWATRVFLFTYAVVGLSLGLVLYRWVNLTSILAKILAIN